MSATMGYLSLALILAIIIAIPVYTIFRGRSPKCAKG